MVDDGKGANLSSTLIVGEPIWLSTLLLAGVTGVARVTALTSLHFYRQR
jgi:hypothetical protein